VVLQQVELSVAHVSECRRESGLDERAQERPQRDGEAGDARQQDGHREEPAELRGGGHVDVEFADDGSVEYLAVGRRESGIGATLPPGSAAVAVRADPPNSASPGDSVQVWTAGEDGAPKQVTNAELRGTADDVVTLALDEEEAEQLDPERRYRLVTLPVESRADREFAAQLRAAEETTGIVTVGEGSALASSVVGSVDVAIVAIRTADGDIVAIPSQSRAFAAGEIIHAIARPEALRRLEAAAAASDERPTEPQSIPSNSARPDVDVCPTNPSTRATSASATRRRSRRRPTS
jgi:hypothetical protein